MGVKKNCDNTGMFIFLFEFFVVVEVQSSASNAAATLDSFRGDLLKEEMRLLKEENRILKEERDFLKMKASEHTANASNKKGKT